MDINRSTVTIAEIRDMWNRKELVVNRNYQRSSSVWPEAARTYLVDTVLSAFVVPKIYLYQVFDKPRKKIIREIVDGQQRITTLLAFLNDEFALTKRSAKFAGKKFSDLEESDQERFLTYAIECDIISTSESSDLLAMFTRMNAYTAPLNSAEKRHAQYEGPFKWFVLKAATELGPTLVELKILTAKQSVRMLDAEFITELAVVLDEGIVDKSERSLSQIYKRHDNAFPQEDDYRMKIDEFVRTLTVSLAPLRDTFLMKPYVCHSLFCALMQRKYGIPNGGSIGRSTDGVFFQDLSATIDELSRLAEAHEQQDTKGKYGEYVVACLSTTHRVKQRLVRSQYLAQALR